MAGSGSPLAAPADTPLGQAEWYARRFRRLAENRRAPLRLEAVASNLHLEHPGPFTLSHEGPAGPEGEVPIFSILGRDLSPCFSLYPHEEAMAKAVRSLFVEKFPPPRPDAPTEWKSHAHVYHVGDRSGLDPYRLVFLHLDSVKSGRYGSTGWDCYVLTDHTFSPVLYAPSIPKTESPSRTRMDGLYLADGTLLQRQVLVPSARTGEFFTAEGRLVATFEPLHERGPAKGPCSLIRMVPPTSPLGPVIQRLVIALWKPKGPESSPENPHD